MQTFGQSAWVTCNLLNITLSETWILNLFKATNVECCHSCFYKHNTDYGSYLLNLLKSSMDCVSDRNNVCTYAREINKESICQYGIQNKSGKSHFQFHCPFPEIDFFSPTHFLTIHEKSISSFVVVFVLLPAVNVIKSFFGRNLDFRRTRIVRNNKSKNCMHLCWTEYSNIRITRTRYCT